MCRLDKIIVLDLEATCWDGPPPEGERQEIIEIGLCVYDVKKEFIQDQVSFLVKPKYSTISEYCKNLTGINTGPGIQGRYLHEVLGTIKKHFSIKSCAWASWGYGDRHQLLDECIRKKIEYPFCSQHLDIQALFCYKHKLSRAPGLQEALAMTMYEFMGSPHNAGDDAYNAARILKEVLR